MSVGKIWKFEVGNGTWPSDVDRLDMYFLVNEIKDELKLLMWGTIIYIYNLFNVCHLSISIL